MTDPSSTSVLTFHYVNAAEVVLLATVLPLLALSVVGLRLYTRMTTSLVGLDDWLMVPGALLYTGMCICMLIGVSNQVIGYSSDTSFNPPLQAYLVPKSDLFARLLFVFQLLFITAFGFIKCSIVALYRRIFVDHSGSRFDIACKVMTGVIIVWSTMFFIIVNLSCGTSPWHFWGTKTEQSACDTFAATQGLAGTDMVIDTALILLPQPLIWTMKLSIKKKLAISILIALACSCIGADIAQTVLLTQIRRASEFQVPMDQAEVISLIMYYTCIDGGLAVTAACLVTLRPLLRNTSLGSMIRSVKSSFGSLGSTHAPSRMSKLWNVSKNTDSSGDTQVTRVDDVENGAFSVGEKEI